MKTDPSEAETLWTDFLRSLMRRCQGAHAHLAALPGALHAQRLAYANKTQRRTNVVGVFPNDASIARLVGAMLREQSDKWSLNRRYVRLEGLQSLSAEPHSPRIETFSGIPE